VGARKTKTGATKMKKNRKLFVIDTSVLLYDKHSIHSFPGNDVVIPIIVLDELDRFKEKSGVVGESARYVNRYLDDLRSKGDLHKGILVEEIDQTIKVELEGTDNVPKYLDAKSADNKIISCALNIKNNNSDRKLVVITKDINFRVKCDALGLSAEDYYRDKVLDSDDDMYKGYLDIEVDSKEIIDKLYNTELSKTEETYLYEDINDCIDRDFYENEFLCITHDSASFLGMVKQGRIVRLKSEKDFKTSMSVNSKNREQLYALNALMDESVDLVTITGLAGSGKTFITLMAAMSGLASGKYDRIVITRNVQPVGKDIGFLPGDLNDKMMPWMSPIMDNFRHAFKDQDLGYFEMMLKKGSLEIAPLSYMRGRTFSNTFLIFDEAQNATIHEIKTVVTRIGENSKIVLLGDTDQIDTPYIDSLSNGLTIIAEKFKNEHVAAHVKLKKGERSYLSAIAAKII
jgi:PhoH-like ATPase